MKEYKDILPFSTKDNNTEGYLSQNQKSKNLKEIESPCDKNGRVYNAVKSLIFQVAYDKLYNETLKSGPEVVTIWDKEGKWHSFDLLEAFTYLMYENNWSIEVKEAKNAQD